MKTEEEGKKVKRVRPKGGYSETQLWFIKNFFLLMGDVCPENKKIIT